MRVLFVCTGNTCRSPMAEAVFRELAAERGLDAECLSAGVMAFDGGAASAGAEQAMLDMGIDLSGHRAVQLLRGHAEECDIILCMSQSHIGMVRDICGENAPVNTLLGFANGKQGSIADPFGGDSEEYRQCAAQIYDAVSRVVDKLLLEDD